MTFRIICGIDEVRNSRMRCKERRISMPGLGGRLRQARDATNPKLSQEAVAERISVSWISLETARVVERVVNAITAPD